MRSNNPRKRGHRKRFLQIVPVICIFAALYKTRGSLEESISIQAELDEISSRAITTVSLEPTDKPAVQSPIAVEDTQQGNEPDNMTEWEEDGAMDRAIVAISMGGNAAKAKMVERFVWSARNKGEFKGPIVLLTDAPSKRYDGISEWTDKFIAINPPVEDFSKDHEYVEMARKRFKTFVLQYIDLDPRLKSVKLVYYLDVDIVFGSPLAPFFEGIEEKYQIGRTTPGPDDPANMWMFKGNSEKWSIQGGQMVLDRATSQPCLDRWRWYMDHNLGILKDQVFLNKMFEEEKKGKTPLACKIVSMDQENYIEFPENRDLVKISEAVKNSSNNTSGRTYSPLVHIRNTGEVKKTSKWNYKRYMLDVLGIKKEEDLLGISQKQLLN
jgi:hypothetical protein